jgi:hypothetical protein
VFFNYAFSESTLVRVMRKFSIEQPVPGSVFKSTFKLENATTYTSVIWIGLSIFLIVSFFTLLLLGEKVFAFTLSGSDNTLVFVVDGIFLTTMTAVAVTHRLLFVKDYPSIAFVLDIHMVYWVIGIVIIMDLHFNCFPAYSCGKFCIFHFIWFCIALAFNIAVLSPCCRHFGLLLSGVVSVEDSAILTYDLKRTTIYNALLDNHSDLRSIAARYEILVNIEATMFVVMVLLIIHLCITGYTDISNALGAVALVGFVSSRNFIFVCEWNSTLIQLERENALSFSNIKVKTLGVTWTYDKILAALTAIISVICRSVVESAAN